MMSLSEFREHMKVLVDSGGVFHYRSTLTQTLCNTDGSAFERMSLQQAYFEEYQACKHCLSVSDRLAFRV